ncbi:hypothetical protein F4802DRAFT_462952 [Xylaria palmicola]|nr:hypothetical protein F4802DRAFT_462952 [Xylaria palmicola]
MAVSKARQAKEEKSAAGKTRKCPNPNQKRGQPTAAARLISSPFIKFGWHKTLSAEAKEAVQSVSSMADSMYMLQIERERPIDSLSLRNGIFWEHRQLVDPSMVSTPALDHIDLFPEDDAVFQETLQKIAKQPSEDSRGFLLHYLFDLRFREFLLLPAEISGHWVTIIARIVWRGDEHDDMYSDGSITRDVTHLAIVDPVEDGRGARTDLVIRRLTSILAEGCIELSPNVSIGNLAVEDISDGTPTGCSWMTGLIAYAVSREFLRRLKTLQWRNRTNPDTADQRFLWAPFEEHYNLDAYRQQLMAACAHQTIEASSYRVRLALEVPSDDSNYDPELLAPVQNNEERVEDETWSAFQSPSHKWANDMVPQEPDDFWSSLADHEEPQQPRDGFASPSPTSPKYDPRSPSILFSSPNYNPVSPPRYVPDLPLSPSGSSHPESEVRTVGNSKPNKRDPTSPNYNPHSPKETSLSFANFNFPSHSPDSPEHGPSFPGACFLPPNYNPPLAPGYVPDLPLSPSGTSHPESEDRTIGNAESNDRTVPVAQMGDHELSSSIPGLSAAVSPGQAPATILSTYGRPTTEPLHGQAPTIVTPTSGFLPSPVEPVQAEDLFDAEKMLASLAPYDMVSDAQGMSRKRRASQDGDGDGPPPKIARLEGEQPVGY